MIRIHRILLKNRKVSSIFNEIMRMVRYCALITVYSNGQPHARAMDAFAPDDSMIVWLATNPKSRKVGEITNNQHVSLYYAKTDGSGYVTLNGKAQIVDNPGEKESRWKDEWQAYYCFKSYYVTNFGKKIYHE